MRCVLVKLGLSRVERMWLANYFSGLRVECGCLGIAMQVVC